MIMTGKFIHILLLCCFFCGPMTVVSACSDKQGLESTTNALTSVALIPQPESLVYGSNNIALPSAITLTNEIKGVPASLLVSTLEQVCNEVQTVSNDNAFVRVLHNSNLGDDEYSINIGAENIQIEYSQPQGLLWGIQTLRQIILQCSTDNIGNKTIPMLSLQDKPKKNWRGFHVDVARHAFTMNYLKKIVDCLSFYKINKLQLHLTDDQGWRIEIKKYPTLTSVGGWRQFDEYDKRCIELSNADTDYLIDSRFIRNGNEYGGYYTQEELKDFVKYALDRGVDVIPEIDMPGHFSAAIKAFPNLSCTGGADWGKEFSFPVCAGKTENYTFIKNILDEVLAIFPSEYIHIGADEVETDNWTVCPYCQKMIKDNNLMNTSGLLNYFIKDISDYLKSKGKKVMVWDDAFYKRKPLDLIYTYWRDWLPEQPGDITQSGHSMIFMEWGRFYLSGTPSDKALKSLYTFTYEPQFPGIIQSKVTGFQACVWTEMIPNERKFGEHVFPSLQAFAEVAWGSTRDWDRFVRYLPWHLKWLNSNGIHCRKPDFLK